MISQHLKTCILHMADNGASVSYIAKKLKKSERTVRYVLGHRSKVQGDPIIRRIEAERVRQGYTMATLSTKAGYNEAQWQRVSAGKNDCSFQCVQSHAQVLGLKLEVNPA